MKNQSKKIVGFYHYGVILTYLSVIAAIVGMCFSVGGNKPARPEIGVICLLISGRVRRLRRSGGQDTQKQDQGRQNVRGKNRLSQRFDPPSESPRDDRFGMALTAGILCPCMRIRIVRAHSAGLFRRDGGNPHERRKLWPQTLLRGSAPLRTWLSCFRFSILSPRCSRTNRWDITPSCFRGISRFRRRSSYASKCPSSASRAC